MIEVKAGQKISIDVSAYMAQVRYGLPCLFITRPTETIADTYAPIHQKYDGSCIVWKVSEYDAAITGEGRAQIVITGISDTIMGDAMTIWVDG